MTACSNNQNNTASTPQKQNRSDLLARINHASFVVDDVKLYLDTHPCDSNALSLFFEYSKIRNKALKEYAEIYGPLTVDTASASENNYWNWINEPWPWQKGGC